jgi:hypothetical protein
MKAGAVIVLILGVMITGLSGLCTLAVGVGSRFHYLTQWVIPLMFGLPFVLLGVGMVRRSLRSLRRPPIVKDDSSDPQR